MLDSQLIEHQHNNLISDKNQLDKKLNGRGMDSVQCTNEVTRLLLRLSIRWLCTSQPTARSLTLTTTWKCNVSPTPCNHVYWTRPLLFAAKACNSFSILFGECLKLSYAQNIRPTARLNWDSFALWPLHTVTVFGNSLCHCQLSNVRVLTIWKIPRITYSTKWDADDLTLFNQNVPESHSLKACRIARRSPVTLSHENTSNEREINASHTASSWEEVWTCLLYTSRCV